MESTVFFTQDSKNNSLPVEISNLLNAEEPVLRARKPKKYGRSGSSTYFGYGFPGMPFDRGEQEADSFCQGEDIIIDAVLYFLGKFVDLNTYSLSVILKTSLRAITPVWVGEISNGIYPVEQPGHFTIWIPSSITSEFTAGTYYLDIQLKEPLAAGAGPSDRVVQLVSYVFNLAYCAMSPKPENVYNASEHRSKLEPTWPNTPNPAVR
jgi:hypothetical protein